MKATIFKTIALLVPAFLVACQPPARGKDYLKAHPQELAEVLKACADGTHRDAQECSNAESVKTLNQKLRSLSPAH